LPAKTPGERARVPSISSSQPTIGTTGQKAHVGGAALVAERWVALGCDAGRVYLLDREYGLTIWVYDTGGSIRCTPTVIGDRLLVPSMDGQLYCFGEDGSNVEPADIA
jgi:outer membrane protein assembly factor BamB